MCMGQDISSTFHVQQSKGSCYEYGSWCMCCCNIVKCLWWAILELNTYKNVTVLVSSESSYGEVNCIEMESGPWDTRKWYVSDKWALFEEFN